MSYAVYTLTNTSTLRTYVGVTPKLVNNRFSYHVMSAFGYLSDTHLSVDIRALGREGFKVTTIAHNLTKRQAEQIASWLEHGLAINYPYGLYYEDELDEGAELPAELVPA